MLKPAVLALALLAGSTAAARPIIPDDIAQLLSGSDPQVDPAGQWVTYTVAGTDVAADKGFSHVWMTAWDGSRSVQLTARAKESEKRPRFGPDGKWLAFISSRGDEKHDDAVWLMDRAGGEGQPLPGVTGSVVSY